MEIHAEPTPTATAVSATSDLDQSAAQAVKALRVLSRATVLLATTASTRNATTEGKLRSISTINMCDLLRTIQTPKDLTSLLCSPSKVMEIHAESTPTATAASAALDLDQSAALAAKVLRVLSMVTVLLATIASRTACLIRRENATTGATMIHAGLMTSVTGASAMVSLEQKVRFCDFG
jgi:hypothetical protein